MSKNMRRRRRSYGVVGVVAASGVAMSACSVGIITSPTDPVNTQSTAPSTDVASSVQAGSTTATTGLPLPVTTVESTDAPPDTSPVSVPADVTEGSVVDTTPPPPDGYPPSVLGEIDLSSERLTLRPVAQCRHDGGLRAPGEEELTVPYPAVAMDCLLGPAYLTGSNLTDAVTSVDNATANWVVIVEMTPDGLAAFNQLAKICYAAEPACPSQQIAIVFDGVIASAPFVRLDAFEEAIEITGPFDEDEANELALTINQGG